MKEVLKNISEGLVIVVVVAIFITLLNVLDKSEERKAIARCNGKENIVTKYTNQGDKYYVCKEQ